MAVITVKAKNFKKLEDFEGNFDGKTIFVIGDTGEGKTTLLKIILSTLMIEDFPEDPITTGKESGFIEAVHSLNGHKYTIRRNFTNDKTKKTRFTVTDEMGGRHTLSELLEKIFGAAFTNAYFDYNEFFIKSKSSETRSQYMIKAVGGEKVIENINSIKRLRRERGKIGSEVEKYTYVIQHSTLNPETLDADREFYKDPRTNDEAVQKKQDILNKRKSITNLNTQLSVVKEGNAAFELSQENLTELDKEIADLEHRLELARDERAQLLKWQSENPADFKRQQELAIEIKNAEEFNKEIEKEADLVYDDLVAEVNVYNNMRNELINVLHSYNELLKNRAEWKEKDEEIKALIGENKKIFTKKLPIEGMTLEIDDEDKITVMYDGREFCLDNLSKGKSLRLAMEIQRALNPNGLNLLAIPEAQSLGSELDEILQECRDHDIQAIVEITERKQKFQIKFEEDFLN